MKITMTQTVRGSIDGVTVQDLIEGETYDTVDTNRGVRLAQAHIRNGVAVAFVETAPAPPVAPQAPTVKARRSNAKARK